MSKETYRNKYKRFRESISDKDLEDKSLAIANNVLSLDIWDYSFYHIFLPIQKLREVNTEYILSILNGKDKNIVISRSDLQNRTMSSILLTDNTIIKPNKWGIPEPIGGIPIAEHQLEVIFVPLLAFDLQGHRIGYGKGFYDRFLATCPKNILKIGLSLFEAESKLPSTQDDIQLTHCITANKIHQF